MHGKEKKKRDIKICVSLVKTIPWHSRRQKSGNIREIAAWPVPCAESMQTCTV